jgi:hypothetical protein
MTDLKQSEAIVLSSLLNEWTDPLPPALASLILHAPACFCEETPSGKIAVILRELHRAEKPSHPDAVLKIALEKKVIDLPQLSWWAWIVGSGAMPQVQAELEAKTMLEAYEDEQFRRACIEIGQRVTESPDSMKGGRKIMRQLLDEHEHAPFRNGNGHVEIERITRKCS